MHTHMHAYCTHRYLKGADLGPNVIANPDLLSTVEDADVLVFCAPHQFVRSICKQLIGKIKRDAIAISLIKVCPLGGTRRHAAAWSD